MAYDPAANRLILFGGITKLSNSDQPGQYLNDTWEFSLDALQWTQLTNNTVMPSLQNNQALYVDDAQAVFLYGGTYDCEEENSIDSFLGTVCISDMLYKFDCGNPANYLSHFTSLQHLV